MRKTIGSARMIDGLYYFEDNLPSNKIVLMHSRVLECKFFVGSFLINNFHIEMIKDQPFEITLEINVLNKRN